MKFSAPWKPLSGEESTVLTESVTRLIAPDHLLYQASFRVIASHLTSHMVLCEVFGYQWRFALIEAPDVGKPLGWPSRNHRIKDEEAWERRLSRDVEDFERHDIELEMDDEIAAVFLKMPAQCQYLCCGFGCMTWDQGVYREYAPAGLTDRLLIWMQAAIERISHDPGIRYVNASAFEIRGGDPESTVAVFKTAITALTEEAT